MAERTPSATSRPRRIPAVRLELRKLRRKHLPLVALALMALELVWLGYGWSGDAVSKGDWRAIYWQLPMLNAIFLPLLASIASSTVCDIESPGGMLKELLTLQSPRELFRAKWQAITLVLGLLVVAQTAASLALTSSLGFLSLPDAIAVAQYAVSTLAVSLLVATLVQALCLILQNQFLPLVVGVALSFLGLFSMYLPMAFARLVPSSYYALLSTVEMSSDAGRVAFASRAWPVADLAVIIILTVAIYGYASRGFSRKEL